MIDLFTENINIIVIIVVCLMVYSFLVSPTLTKWFLSLEENNFMECFRLSVFILFFGLSFMLQTKFNFISFGDATSYSLILGVFTVYGIFLAFLQFAIGFAIQNKNDQFWGVSITKHFIQRHLPFSIFKSRIFLGVLVYVAAFPLISNSLSRYFSFFSLNIGAFHSLWESGVFVVIMFYIFLFIRTLSVINSFFDIQEHNDQSIIYSIVNKEAAKYRGIFLHFFPRDTNIFFRSLFRTIQRLEKSEGQEMFLKIYYPMLDLEMLKGNAKKQKVTDQRMLIDLLRMFSMMFDYLREAQLQIEMKELLSICKKQNNMIHRCLSANSDTDDVFATNNVQSYLQRMLYVPAFIWESVQSIEDVDRIHSYLEAISIPHLSTKKEKQLNHLFRDSFWEMLNHYRVYQSDIPDGHALFKSRRYNTWQQTAIDEQTQQFIYHYILNLEHHPENESYIIHVTNALDFKYCASIIFYFLLYPSDNEWKSKVVLFKKVMNNHPFYEFDDDTINFVTKSVSRTGIGHRIESNLVKKVMHDLKTISHFDVPFVQTYLMESCISLAKWIKLRYIFSELHFHFRVSFSEKLSNLELKFDPDGKWKVDFIKELIDTPVLLKQEELKEVLYLFCSEVLESNYPRTAYLSYDFRIFHVNPIFLFTEENFAQLVAGNIPPLKGIIDYLFIHLTDSTYAYIITDSMKLTFLMGKIDDQLNIQNQTIRDYLRTLVDQASACGQIISASNEEKLLHVYHQYHQYHHNSLMGLKV